MQNYSSTQYCLTSLVGVVTSRHVLAQRALVTLAQGAGVDVPTSGISAPNGIGHFLSRFLKKSAIPKFSKSKYFAPNEMQKKKKESYVYFLGESRLVVTKWTLSDNYWELNKQCNSSVKIFKF